MAANAPKRLILIEPPAPVFNETRPGRVQVVKYLYRHSVKVLSAGDNATVAGKICGLNSRDSTAARAQRFYDLGLTSSAAFITACTLSLMAASIFQIEPQASC